MQHVEVMALASPLTSFLSEGIANQLHSTLSTTAAAEQHSLKNYYLN